MDDVTFSRALFIVFEVRSFAALHYKRDAAVTANAASISAWPKTTADTHDYNRRRRMYVPELSNFASLSHSK